MKACHQLCDMKQVCFGWEWGPQGCLSASCAPTATGEVADVALEYIPPEQLGLAAADLPRGRGWSPPAPLKWPFSGGLTDYMLPVCPSRPTTASQCL